MGPKLLFLLLVRSVDPFLTWCSALRGTLAIMFHLCYNKRKKELEKKKFTLQRVTRHQFLSFFSRNFKLHYLLEYIILALD